MTAAKAKKKAPAGETFDVEPNTVTATVKPAQDVVVPEPEAAPLVEVRDDTPQGQAISMTQLIREAALNPEIDIERMRELRSFQKEIQADAYAQIFNEEMAKVQAQIQPVVANATGERSKFATMSNIHKTAKPIWTAAGFSVMTVPSQSLVENHIKLTTQIRHSAGHMVEFCDDWPMDTSGPNGAKNKTDIQGKGSTISYARRYQECMAFDIAIDHDDNDGAGSNEISSAAGDWIAAVNESATLEDLQKHFSEGWTALEGDGYGRNQLSKAKDNMKKRLTDGTA
tara:strand:+ start:8788 stop:9639 length:852 start_codon:yes stop_codon:yes gene_type:complete